MLCIWVGVLNDVNFIWDIFPFVVVTFIIFLGAAISFSIISSEQTRKGKEHNFIKHIYKCKKNKNNIKSNHVKKNKKK